jgi:integrase/recombinase XerD
MAVCMSTWVAEMMRTSTGGVAPRCRGEKLTRNGVDYILKKAVAGAMHDCPGLATKHISPHVIRHATASHLLQAGIDISVIALWLGHESVDTTHINVEADLTHKEEALSRLQPAGQRTPRFHATDKVMAFLAAL